MPTAASPWCCSTKTPQHSYVAQTGLIGGNYPTHKTVMQLQPGERALQDGQDS